MSANHRHVLSTPMEDLSAWRLILLASQAVQGQSEACRQGKERQGRQCKGSSVRYSSGQKAANMHGCNNRINVVVVSCLLSM